VVDNLQIDKIVIFSITLDTTLLIYIDLIFGVFVGLHPTILHKVILNHT
jgi:hypothetical protein